MSSPASMSSPAGIGAAENPDALAVMGTQASGLPTEELLRLYDKHERVGSAYPGYERIVTEHTIRMLQRDLDDPAEGHHFVIWSRLDADTADAVIARETEWFARQGLGFEWKWYAHDRPADLLERLGAFGFVPGEEETIMAAELEPLVRRLAAAAKARPPVRRDIRTIRVTTADTLEDYERVNRLCWPDDAGVWIEQIKATLREHPERMSAWVAYLDGKPASAARIDFPTESPFASLWGGATLDDCRNQGLYTALLTARAREALERGYRFLTIDASPMSRPIVQKHGFRVLDVSRACIRDKPAG